jgi:hypothetical protein
MRADRIRCACCGWQLRPRGGRLPRHLVHGSVCLGSARPVAPEAFGVVNHLVPMGGTPCAACGQPVRVMTLHDDTHAAWPCGDAFPVQQPVPALPERPAETVTVPEQTRRVAAVGLPTVGAGPSLSRGAVLVAATSPARIRWTLDASTGSRF